MSHLDLLEQVPLYALHALPDDERIDFDKHLEACNECQRLLDETYTITASFAEDGPAPTMVWDRIAAEITEQTPIADLGRERGRRRWMSMTLVAAAAALVFVGITLVQRSMINSFEGPDGVVALAEAAAGDPDSFVGEFLVDDEVVAKVVLDSDGLGYVIPETSLTSLSEDRTYQLWVITAEEKVISAGVLGHTPTASTFTWSGDVSGFALTREIAGGVVTSDGDVVSVVTEA